MAVSIKTGGTGNKPLPRKKRVLNRGQILSRSNDDVKNPSVTLMDIDTAIVFYFEDATGRLKYIGYKLSDIERELYDIDNRLTYIDTELGKMTKEIRWND